MEREGPAKVKAHHDDAFRYINEGLKFDEQGNKQKALQFYHKGLRSLVVGLSVYCSDSGPGLEQTKQLQKKMKSAKEQVKERIQALSASLNPNPSAPSEDMADGQSQNGHLATDEELEACYLADQEGTSWEDVKELLVLEHSVKMFFVSGQGSVTTLSQPQTLYAYQFVNYKPDSHEAPAFLQCGAWMFPMVPGRSPVLNTEPHTYMFPDITIDPSSPPPSKPRPQRGFASVGLILNPNISSMELKRFERILKCYTDFHHYTPPKYSEEEVRDVDQRRDEDTTPSVPAVESTDEHGSSVAVAVRPSTDVVPADSSQGTSWGRKVSKGITIGSELIAWGLTKGAEVGSHLMQKGSAKLRENLKPNEKPVEVEEKVQDNIRQVKTVAGMACQVSGAVVAAVSAMTVELGRRLAPVIVEKGGKALPDSLKKRDDVDGSSTVDEFVKVAVSGARGAATIYQGLENSWKVLYKSLQHATVQTVDHKYGPAVAEATNNSMGAAGLVLQTCWNVENLGIKALAKRTAKDTGKEVVKEAEKKYITDGKQ
ncbi:spartin-like isoform X2 [Orbicella faveolata]|uniref:spartin-like isoform X1 n=1 Tax=Orbicella faveolata TaxID=48498 RepID=UPI0009E46C1E|nr:spartin-like isoform X1 [Orbicella faveolata]XP_020602012.1 spartin-like isoform X2 [Orbicella faveolata]